jgi:hypothetical protein
LLRDRLDPGQRAAVEAVCTDMHRPYINVVREVLTDAEVVFDKVCAAAHTLSYDAPAVMCRRLPSNTIAAAKLLISVQHAPHNEDLS